MKPHVTLNCAMSLDGIIGRPGKRIRLSNERDLRRVHEMRAECDAIMVGVNTVITDNPKLTVRHARGRNPVRVVVDSRARTPPASRVLDGSSETIIAVSKKAPEGRRKALMKKAVVVTAGETQVNLKKLMNHLHSRGIRTLMLEGGGTLIRSMLESRLVDEIYLTIAPVILGDGIRWINGGVGRKTELGYRGCRRLGDQILLHYAIK